MADGFFAQPFRFSLTLDTIEACRVRLHPRAECAAQQLVDRQAMKLSGNVPERDIHRADARHHRTLATKVARHVVHAMPEYFDVERIRADKQGLERLVDHRRRDLRRFESLGERLAPSGNALVSEDFNQCGGALPDPALGKSERLRQRAFQHMDIEVGYFHAFPPVLNRGGRHRAPGPR